MLNDYSDNSRHNMTKNLQNSKFYFFKSDLKTDKKHLQDPKKLQKTICNEFRTILDQNRVLNIKSPKNYVKMANFCKFLDFKMQKSTENGRTLAETWPEGPAYLKFWPKNFLCHKTKNWRFYPKTPNPLPKNTPFFFWGGGGGRP